MSVTVKNLCRKIIAPLLLRLKAKILDGFLDWFNRSLPQPGLRLFTLCHVSCPPRFFFSPSSLSMQSVFQVFWFKPLSSFCCLEILGALEGPPLLLPKTSRSAVAAVLCLVGEFPHSWSGSTKPCPVFTQLDFLQMFWLSL